MNWLKGLGISIKVAIGALLMALSVMAYQRQKGAAEKWHDKAVDLETGKVRDATITAAAASTQAKFHDNKAKEIKQKAEAQAVTMGGKDEDVASILDQFSKSS